MNNKNNLDLKSSHNLLESSSETFDIINKSKSEINTLFSKIKECKQQFSYDIEKLLSIANQQNNTEHINYLNKSKQRIDELGINIEAFNAWISHFRVNFSKIEHIYRQLNNGLIEVKDYSKEIKGSRIHFDSLTEQGKIIEESVILSIKDVYSNF